MSKMVSYEARCELSFVLMIVGLAQVVIAVVTTQNLFTGWLVIGLVLILASVVWMPTKAPPMDASKPRTESVEWSETDLFRPVSEWVAEAEAAVLAET